MREKADKIENSRQIKDKNNKGRCELAKFTTM